MDPQEIEPQLWDYIDGLATSGQRTEIEKRIAENAAWRTLYHELLEVKELMASSELEQPSLRFTKNVMDTIAQLQIAPATKKYINNKIIVSLALFFITLIVGFIIYGIGQIDWSVNGSSGNVITKIDYSKMFNNNFVNLFMVINVVLGLMILDRVLSAKNKKIRELEQGF